MSTLGAELRWASFLEKHLLCTPETQLRPEWLWGAFSRGFCCCCWERLVPLARQGPLSPLVLPCSIGWESHSHAGVPSGAGHWPGLAL